MHWSQFDRDQLSLHGYLAKAEMEALMDGCSTSMTSSTAKDSSLYSQLSNVVVVKTTIIPEYLGGYRCDALSWIVTHALVLMIAVILLLT